jgi:hypothetical protein
MWVLGQKAGYDVQQSVHECDHANRYYNVVGSEVEAAAKFALELASSLKAIVSFTYYEVEHKQLSCNAPSLHGSGGLA